MSALAIIVASLGASITIITCYSLVFVNEVMKREAKLDEEPPSPPEPPKLRPFQTNYQPCALCAYEFALTFKATKGGTLFWECSNCHGSYQTRPKVEPG